MIHGAKATSTKEMLVPRKKGPVTCEALTRAVIAVWRVDVKVIWRGAGLGGDGVDVPFRLERLGGVSKSA